MLKEILIAELILIILFLIIFIIYKNTKKRTTPPSSTTDNGPTKDDSYLNNIEYIKGAYTPKWMFSYNEKAAYYKLNKIAKENNLYVFAKVRLFDLVTPIPKHPKYKTNLYRIQAKHVDFVLTNEKLVAKYIIELDDSSHDTQDRKERDKFVDMVLTSCGYKVLHTRDIQEEEILHFIKK